jgi:hypothetical protein
MSVSLGITKGDRMPTVRVTTRLVVVVLGTSDGDSVGWCVLVIPAVLLFPELSAAKSTSKLMCNCR